VSNDPDEPVEEDVPCPVCAGTGYIVEPCNALDWCDECGASGEVSPAHADKLARRRASNVSISSYLYEPK
jgi:RecJ-like exonuclease